MVESGRLHEVQRATRLQTTTNVSELLGKHYYSERLVNED